MGSSDTPLCQHRAMGCYSTMVCYSTIVHYSTILLVGYPVISESLSAHPVIVFPQDYQTRLERQYNLSKPVETNSAAIMSLDRFIPKGCEDSSSDYCEAAGDYPDKETVREIVVGTGDHHLARLLFTHTNTPVSSTREPVPVLYDQGQFGDISSRLPPDRGINTESSTATIPREQPWDESDLVLETPLCDFQETFVFPRTARTRARQWRFVINLPSSDQAENFVQAVRIKKCLNAGSGCNLVTCDDTQTVCRQKYDYTRLLAISDEGKQYVDEFRFPSGCVCHSKKSRYPVYNFEFVRSGETLLENARSDENNFNVVNSSKSE